MRDITVEERQRLIDDILRANVQGWESLGVSIRRLRVEVTGLDQDTFAAMCRMSTKALYQLENDKGNPTLGTLNGILNKFGMRMALASIVADAAFPARSGKAEGRPLPRGTSPSMAKRRAAAGPAGKSKA
ncbi:MULTISPECIES: helix-turn-helix domain-containing protein [Pseudomonas]|uniref:helix-turn-helix domain-containing protein n=1 Tax=Pseudomonas TaxID=286 RepID=UPI0023D8C2CC|nr:MULTISPECIES: helix-turn-helix transcriptional regulator [unclassified Pseudomonas]MED5606632.1 helix-turn-helix transcriptional regulator [Pseudomonas sp. JH-2]